MGSEFLKYYNNILSEADESSKKDKKDKKEAKATSEDQLIENAKNSALSSLDNVTDACASAAATDIKTAYHKNNTMFDDLAKNDGDDEGDDEDTENNKEDNETDTDEEDIDNDLTLESTDIKTSFKDYYLSVVTEEDNHELVDEGKTEDVTDGEYVIRIDDDHNFKVVNIKDPTTKFTEDDYKKVEEWVNLNKDLWRKYAKKYGGSASQLTPELIDKAFESFDDINKNVINALISKVRENSHLSQFKAFLKKVNEEEGYKEEEELNEIKIGYAKALIFILNDVKDKMPNKEQRAEKKKAEAEAKEKINASNISAKSSNSDERKLFNAYFKKLDKTAKDNDLEEHLSEGTGDADDQEFDWADADNYSSWVHSGVKVMDILLSKDNSLQEKYTAMCYLRDQINKKKDAGQYYGDDYQNKIDPVNKVIEAFDKYLTKEKNKIKNINLNKNFQFDFKNKDPMGQIKSLSK